MKKKHKVEEEPIVIKEEPVEEPKVIATVDHFNFATGQTTTIVGGV